LSVVVVVVDVVVFQCGTIRERNRKKERKKERKRERERKRLREFVVDVSRVMVMDRDG